MAHEIPPLTPMPLGMLLDRIAFECGERQLDVWAVRGFLPGPER